MSDYGLHSRVPIAGMSGWDEEPIVELGVIQTVPEGQIVYDDKPTFMEPYERQARCALTPSEAREVASALENMADRIEEE